MANDNPLLNWEGPAGDAGTQPTAPAAGNPLLNWSEEPKAGEARAEAPPSKTESFLRGAGQGLTLGWGDKLLGLGAQMSALNGPGAGGGMDTFPAIGDQPVMDADAARAYGEKISRENREANEKAQKANPLTYAGGNVAGSLPIMAAAPSGFLGNAAIGAAQGASEGDTLGERAGNALIGGGVGGALGGAGHYIGKNVFGLGRGVNPLVKDALDMGVEVPRYLANEGYVVPSVAQTLKNMPVAGAPIEAAAAKMRDQMGNVLRDASHGIDAEQAGQAATDSLKDWITRGSHDLGNQMYTRASQAMNPNVTAPLNATAKTASDILSRRGAAAIAGDSGALGEVQDAISRPGGLTYEGLKDLRSSIGRKLENSLLPGDIDKAELKQIYGSLTRDLDAAAFTAGGQKGLDLHNQANQMYQYVAKDRKDLAGLLGGPAANASPEKVFANVVRAASAKGASANAGLLEKAKNIMPASDWDNLAAGTLGHMGMDAAGNFSPDRFLGPNGYYKMSAKAKDLLFGAPGAPERDQLENLAKIADRYGEYSRYANPSGTGHAVLNAAAGKSFLQAPFSTTIAALLGRSGANAMSAPAGIPTVPGRLLGAAGVVAAPLARTAATRGPALLADPIGRNIIDPVLQRANNAVNPQPQRATGGRVARAAGGRLGSAMTADMLIAAAERAKKQINASTAALLHQPDEHIVKALDVASAALGK